MRRLLTFPLLLAALLAGGATRIVQDQCGPFTDVTPAFCPYVLEMYYLGITAGTSATTFSLDNPMTRGQAAVFVSKGIDQALARSSRRAALGQWWTTKQQWDIGIGVTVLGGSPGECRSDGADIWVAVAEGSVFRVRASDGKLLESWTGASNAVGVLVTMGRVLVTGSGQPGVLYLIDPSQPAGAVTTAATGLGDYPQGITFDGARIWTANISGSVSIVTPAATFPWTVTNVATGFTHPTGIVFDGTNVWVVESHTGALLKLDAGGAILQTVALPGFPPDYSSFPAFDGHNIWVPYGDGGVGGQIAVVRATDGTVVAILTGNNLGFFPREAAFDGRRVVVANTGGPISVWDAADFVEIEWDDTTLFPHSVCSDGLNFWVTNIGGLNGGNAQLGRF